MMNKLTYQDTRRIMEKANVSYKKIIDQSVDSAQHLVNRLMEVRFPRYWYAQETWIDALMTRLPQLACPQTEGQIIHFFHTLERLIGADKSREALTQLAEKALIERSAPWVGALAYRQARALWRGAIRNQKAMEAMTQTPDLIDEKTVDRLVQLSIRRIKQPHTPQPQMTAATLLIVRLANTRPALLDEMKARDKTHFRVALGRCEQHEELAMFKRDFLMRYSVKPNADRVKSRVAL